MTTYISFFGEINYEESEKQEGWNPLENEIFDNSGSGSDYESAATYSNDGDTLTVATHSARWNGEEWETETIVYKNCTRLNMGAAPVQMVEADEVPAVREIRADFDTK